MWMVKFCVANIFSQTVFSLLALFMVEPHLFNGEEHYNCCVDHISLMFSCRCLSLRLGSFFPLSVKILRRPCSGRLQ